MGAHSPSDGTGAHAGTNEETRCYQTFDCHLPFNFSNIVHYFPVTSDPLDGGFMTSWPKGHVTVADLEGRSQWSLTETSHNSSCSGGRQPLPPAWMAQGHELTGANQANRGRVDEKAGRVREARDEPKRKAGAPAREENWTVACPPFQKPQYTAFAS